MGALHDLVLFPPQWNGGAVLNTSDRPWDVERRDQIRARMGEEKWAIARRTLLAMARRDFEADPDGQTLGVLDGGPSLTHRYVLRSLEKHDARVESIYMRWFDPEFLAHLKMSFEDAVQRLGGDPGPAERQLGD